MKVFKKITDPLLAQLKQGVTPKKLSQSVAFGVVLGSVPVIGVTTSLCVIAAAIFKLNHVAIQTINYLVYPVQIALIIPFLRLGERLFGVTPASLNLTFMMNEFRQDYLFFFQKYGMTALRGVAAWAIIAPFTFAIIFFISKIIFENISNKLHSQH